jgi:NAD(P)-dependent dehydrogenase (short-subunit alcohol dehydrogenase family)
VSAARWHEHVAIVTGGGTGIGRATALEFARRGVRVLITGRHAEPLEETAAEADGIVPVVADVTSEEAARRVVDRAIERWGRIDTLVNNAGMFAARPLADADAETVAALFATNVLGPTLLARAALPHLKATRGAIINVSSTFGHKPSPGAAHYGASKAALEHMTRSWALELAGDGVRVNAVAPGPTETPHAGALRFDARAGGRRPGSRGPAHPARPARRAGRGGALDRAAGEPRERVGHRPGHRRGRRPGRGVSPASSDVAADARSTAPAESASKGESDVVASLRRRG